MDDTTMDPDFEAQESTKRRPGRPLKTDDQSPQPPKERKQYPGGRKGGRKPFTMKGWYKHKDFKGWYHLRCKLEQDLLNATIALPHSAGLTEGRIEELRRIFDREGKVLPKTDDQWERDDLPRVAAIKSIIEARHKIGAETKDTLEKWNNIEIYKIWDRESDARKKDIVLIELEKRKDGAFVESVEKHQKYRDAISRFFDTTVAMPNHGGLTPAQVSHLGPVFDGKHDRPDVIEAWWQRRNALIYILRARKAAGIQEEPDLKETWEGYVLPDPSSPMLDELCVEESGGKVQSVDKKGKVVVNERIGLIPPVQEHEKEKGKELLEMHLHELSPMPDGLVELDYGTA